ncbi:MAG: hypothetical protein AAGF97_09760 [Planctomycetota bacterium]
MCASLAIYSDPTLESHRPLAVSNLAGQSPHIRVQYHRDGKWERFASFRDSNSACACAHRLRLAGHQVRLVSFAIAPAAG